MARHSSRPHSYREDLAIPAFDDTRPLFVFDGHCAMCSTGVRWLMATDRAGRVQFTSGQGPLGSALYRHYGLELDTTFLLIDGGHCWGMSAGVLRLLPVVGGPWRLLEAMRILPEAWRDALYRVIARNRYRWFGRREHCVLLSAEQRARLI